MKDKSLFILSALLLSGAAFGFIQFLSFHESIVASDGISFEDPVFPYIPSYDCSVFIFMITYGSLILYGVLERKKHAFISKLMIAYSLLLIFRIMTLSVLPLKEPADLIYLQDPFLNDLIYPGRMTVDLFFSGHTGLVLLMYFMSKRVVFIVLAFLLGVLLMVQRVHYSIDIIAAIPFAYIAVYLTRRIIHRLASE